MVSRSRHDYVTYLDTVDGKEYMVDGGLDYIRRSVCGKDLSVYLEDGHDKVRGVLEWGTYGRDGNTPFRWVVLKDMDTDHIQAILDTQHQLPDWHKGVFKQELEYRNELPEM